MNISIGYIYMVFATICYSLLYVLFKKAGEKLPPFTVMAISMFVLFVTSIIGSVFLEKFTASKFPSINVVIILIAAGLVNALGFWLVLSAYKYMPVWHVTLFSLFYPIVGGVLAYIILGETLSYKLFIGLAIMALGLYIAVR